MESGRENIACQQSILLIDFRKLESREAWDAPIHSCASRHRGFRLWNWSSRRTFGVRWHVGPLFLHTRLALEYLDRFLILHSDFTANSIVCPTQNRAALRAPLERRPKKHGLRGSHFGANHAQTNQISIAAFLPAKSLKGPHRGSTTKQSSSFPTATQGVCPPHAARSEIRILRGREQLKRLWAVYEKLHHRVKMFECVV